MEFENILKLIDRVSGSGLDSFIYEQNGVKLKLEKNRQKIKVSQAAAEPLQEHGAAFENQAGSTATGVESITSPLVGIFYAAPAEDADPFVKPGDRVKKGQVVGIVEAMKLMNEITSDCDGIVRESCVENGAAVEYGQPLFLIEEA